MLNKQLYEELDREFSRCRVDLDVEDALLMMAEDLADLGVVGREVSVRQQVGRAKVTARGTCEAEADGEEPGVFIRTLEIDGKVFEIGDYLL